MNYITLVVGTPENPNFFIARVAHSRARASRARPS
jgi:hypothetical protein